MKKQPAKRRVHREPDEELIRDYAQHIYEQSGRIPGRDLDNWLEARACLEACIPRHQLHTRLQRHLAKVPAVEAYDPPIEAHNLAS